MIVQTISRPRTGGLLEKAARLDRALDEAKAKGWTVVDMKNDWRKIYPK
jgi:hypothetical protein